MSTCSYHNMIIPSRLFSQVLCQNICSSCKNILFLGQISRLTARRCASASGRAARRRRTARAAATPPSRPTSTARFRYGANIFHRLPNIFRYKNILQAIIQIVYSKYLFSNTKALNRSTITNNHVCWPVTMSKR